MRRRLTPDYVDSLRPPKKGERWIADTIVPGFGVRLRSGKFTKKVFCLRTQKSDGQATRKTLCEARGDLLELARSAAHEQLLRIKNPQKLSAVQRLEAKVPNLTLNEWMDRFLRVKILQGAGRTYKEQLEELYANHADPFIGRKKISDLTTADIQECIRNLGHYPGQARKLQSLLHQSLEFAGRFYFGALQMAYEVNQKSNFSYYPYAQPDFKLEDDKIEKLFADLQYERLHRQQAFVILGVFILLVRPKELLRSTWSQIIDGYFKPLRRAEWRAEIDRVAITGPVAWYFSELRRICDGIEPDSPFLFPSLKSEKRRHLTSYESYWRRVKVEHNLPNESVFYIARSFRNPFYYEMRHRGFAPHVIKQIAATPRPNEAEMSKWDKMLT